MEKIVLYCKSFRRDLERVTNLWKSIQKHNRDNIPFYVSVPKEDKHLFEKNGIPNLLEDEEVFQTPTQGWIQQQIVKASFWKLKLAENYVCIDSDAYFIRDFHTSDFMFDDEVPYTVIHQQKELFTWSVSKVQQLGFNPKGSFMQDREKVMQIFDRKGIYYDFGPVPVIWSCKVWEDLDTQYMTPKEISWVDLLAYSPSEFSWYGESLLHFKSIPIYPLEPLFKVFHYPLQLQEYKQQGVTEEMIAENYMGIIMQSNFGANIKY